MKQLMVSTISTKNQSVLQTSRGFGRLGEYSVELYEECITIKRDEWRKCKLLCESDYCKSICDREYEEGITLCKIEHNHPDVQD